MSWKIALDKAIGIWKDRAQGKRREAECPLCHEMSERISEGFSEGCLRICPLARQLNDHCGIIFWDWLEARGKDRIRLAKKMLTNLKRAKRFVKAKE